MELWQRIVIALLLLLVCSLAAFGVGYWMGDGASRGAFRKRAQAGGSSDAIDDAFEKIRSKAAAAPSDRALIRGAIRGMVDVLKRTDDPYALFYSPRGYDEFQDFTNGRFSGIGVWLKEKGTDLEIVSVLPSTPAVHSGLERGDVVRHIDGLPVDEMTVDEAVGHIKGRAGTKVSLTVERDGRELHFSITRASIELPNVLTRVKGPSLGYIRLFSFGRGAGDQVRDEVESFTDRGVEGIVLDLRDNGGGLFSEAIDTAGVFIEHGEIVTYRTRSKRDIVYRAKGSAYEDLPLVVLVNEGTASASEIVAGALQDRQRAILVGSRTYGKGSVQEVLPLSNSSALKLTTGGYVTPSGRDIDGRGIEPDVEVADVPRVQKARAVEILKGIVLSTSGAQG